MDQWKREETKESRDGGENRAKGRKVWDRAEKRGQERMMIAFI